MALCSVCEREASDLLCGRWYCRQCMQAVLDKPASLTPLSREKVSILDRTGHLVRVPFCSICQDRIAAFIVCGTAICRDCSRDGKLCPDRSEEQADGASDPDKPKRAGLGASIVDFPTEYVCVDVETTGLSPSEDEIIEIAALRVKEGVICDTFTSLIKPSYSHVPWTYAEIQKLGYTTFDDVPRAIFENDSKRKILPNEIVKLTGIKDNMIADAPAIDEVIPQFYEFVGERILIGHNVIFDINFLYDACQQCGFRLQNDFVDTKRIARNLLPELAHYRLSDLAQHFHIVQDQAHRAMADVITTVKAFEAMRSLILQTRTISEYVKGFIDPGKKPSPRSLKKIYAQKRFRPGDLIHPDMVDSAHPLYGKCVVFTGELSITRADAAQMATDVGAIVKTDVSRKTDFLVVGQQDTSLVGSSGISGRERRASELNASGKGNITILSEQDFLDLIGHKMKEGAL